MPYEKEEMGVVGPEPGARIHKGPDIDVPGWKQRYSSPWADSKVGAKPTWYRSRYLPNVTRGTHIYRTQPRSIGPMVDIQANDPTLIPDWNTPALRRLPSVNQNAPYYAHGVGESILATAPIGAWISLAGYALLALAAFYTVK